MKSKEETLAVFKKAIPYFQVLADDTRQMILMVLSDEEELTVNEITERLPLSRPAISHHLKILKQEGVVNLRRQGTKNYYYLTIKESLDLLDELIEAIKSNCIIR